jgi:hypothetical protein
VPDNNKNFEEIYLVFERMDQDLRIVIDSSIVNIEFP